MGLTLRPPGPSWACSMRNVQVGQRVHQGHTRSPWPLTGEGGAAHSGRASEMGRKQEACGGDGELSRLQCEQVRLSKQPLPVCGPGPA